MREIGKGHTALKTFCGFMNMQPPMQIKSFNDMQQNYCINVPRYCKGFNAKCF